MPSAFGSLVLGLALPAATHVSIGASGITPGRAQSLAALAVALISLVAGILALRSTGKGGRAIVALGVGLTALILSVIRIAGSTAIGTGGGRLGAIEALVVALVGMALGGLALSRSRRTTSS